MPKSITRDKPPPKPNPVLQDMWSDVFNVYEDHPKTALVLAQNFKALQDTLRSGDKDGARQVIASLECAIEHLFKRSEFFIAGRKLYQLAVDGKLRPDIHLMKLADDASADSARK